MSGGIDQLNRASRTVHHNDRSYPGFNFFDDDDQILFEAVARGEFNVSGLQNKRLRSHLSAGSGASMRSFGIARRVGQGS